ncbi:MAG: hypothetical protein ACJ761_05165 [Chloroflexota bacterium]
MHSDPPISPFESIPRSRIAIGLHPHLQGGRLAALASGRAVVIDFFSSRRCGTTIGDVTVRFGEPPADGQFAWLSPIQRVPVAANRRLLGLLAAAGPELRWARFSLTRHVSLWLRDPAAWLDFLDGRRPDLAT